MITAGSRPRASTSSKLTMWFTLRCDEFFALPDDLTDMERGDKWRRIKDNPSTDKRGKKLLVNCKPVTTAERSSQCVIRTDR